jgi:hypothetical protein
MKNFYVYNAEGEILRHGYCQERDLEAQAQPGEIVAEGDADFRLHYIADGKVCEKGPQPSPHHLFDIASRSWVADMGAAWASVRAERAAKLAASDWTDTVSAGMRLSSEALARWASYRQALRDITKQPDPLGITWPERPA